MLVYEHEKPPYITIGSLNKLRRRPQRERHQTEGLMSGTISMHVRYKSLHISLLSSGKLERKMTKFCVVYGTWRRRLIFGVSIWN